MTVEASAQDSLKVAVDQRGAWETAAPELGQQAGIFKKHGLTLDLTYPRAESEIETAVISGSADVGVGVGIVEVLRAYATKEAPIRIIGATMTGSANYWYVAASSPIKTITDISGRTIAYSKADASSQYDVFDLIQRYRVKHEFGPAREHRPRMAALPSRRRSCRPSPGRTSRVQRAATPP